MAKRRLFRRPTRRVAALMLGVGVVVGGITGTVAVRRLLESIDGPSLTVPGETTVHLGSGRWIVFERVGSRSQVGPVSTSSTEARNIRPRDVTVRRGESSYPARDLTGSQTITTGGDVYAGAAEFSVPAEGDYEVRIATATTHDAMLARSVSDTFTSVLPWAVPAGLSAIVVVLGLVFVLVPASSDAVAAPVPIGPLPPPGWHPDPGGLPVWRWWDGSQWTHHTAPRSG